MMKNLSTEDRRNLVVGAAVAVAAFVVALKLIRGDGFLAMAGPAYDLPLIGGTGVAELIVSALVAIGSGAWSAGGGVFRKLLGAALAWLRNPSNQDAIIEAIRKLILNRSDANDTEGMLAAQKLRERCLKCGGEKTAES